MKCVLLSVKPKWVAKILNGEKTIEIRKRFPKDFRGWIYIYCTKNIKKDFCMIGINGNDTYCQEHDKNTLYSPNHNYFGNGKVVARFWCDKVDEYSRYDTIRTSEIKKTCLTSTEIWNYANDKKVSFIDISKLEIFDKPKELNEFYGYTDKKVERYTGLPKVRVLTSLTKAPQSWQYIEVEE